ncbi:MAG: OmpA family protein [Polyangiaceae bacterium]|nr:OmpA family protein [Polyangiaceae bacterium]
MNRTTAILLATAVAVGCTRNQQPGTVATSDSDVALDAWTEAPEAVGSTEVGSTKAQIVVSDRIREACGISDAEAYFEYDSAQISRAGNALLERLADCFSTGPLKGVTMVLVGHADSRGSDEYNMVLGSRRAEAVKVALGGFGLDGDVVTTSSRGEMEATGIDTETWSRDRRVDVMTGG